MTSHDLKLDPHRPWCATCAKCGLPVFVRFTPGNALRLGTSVYSIDKDGHQVQPAKIPCGARRGVASSVKP